MLNRKNPIQIAWHNLSLCLEQRVGLDFSKSSNFHLLKICITLIILCSKYQSNLDPEL